MEDKKIVWGSEDAWKRLRDLTPWTGDLTEVEQEAVFEREPTFFNGLREGKKKDGLEDTFEAATHFIKMHKEAERTYLVAINGLEIDLKSVRLEKPPKVKLK